MLAHVFESIDAKKICSFEERHYVRQVNVALVGVQIGQNFFDDFELDLLQFDCAAMLPRLVVERSLLEHCGEVRTSGQNKFVRGNFLVFGF